MNDVAVELARAAAAGQQLLRAVGVEIVAAVLLPARPEHASVPTSVRRVPAICVATAE